MRPPRGLGRSGSRAWRPWNGPDVGSGSDRSADERYLAEVERIVATPERMRDLRRQARSLSYRPTFSLLIDGSQGDRLALRRALGSVRAQAYDRWEVCLVGRPPSLWSRLSPRVRVARAVEGGPGAALSAAFRAARGEFVGVLDARGAIRPDALCEVARLLNEQRDLDCIYTDEDRLSPQGARVPFFKPGWSPDLLTSMDYLGRLTMYRRALVARLGGFRAEASEAAEYDLALRVTEATSRIDHLPLHLHRSWRTWEAGHGAWVAGRRVVGDALKRRGYGERVDPGLVEGRHRARYAIRGSPSVTIIIPTRDRVDLLEPCVESVRSLTDYRHHRVVIVDNQSTDPATKAFLGSFDGEVFPYPYPFHFARMMNEAAKGVGSSDLLLFLNNDTRVIAREWLAAMVEHGQRPEVAAVGARLLFPDGRVQHEGIALGLGDAPAMNLDHEGWWGMGQTVRNCSAVTAACMLIRADTFAALGGFDERLPIAYNDVDLCLRARAGGQLIVYTPHAVLYHDESSTRGDMSHEEDTTLFVERWGAPGDVRDPYYNPNLDPSRPFHPRPLPDEGVGGGRAARGVSGPTRGR